MYGRKEDTTALEEALKETFALWSEIASTEFPSMSPDKKEIHIASFFGQFYQNILLSLSDYGLFSGSMDLTIKRQAKLTPDALNSFKRDVIEAFQLNKEKPQRYINIRENAHVKLIPLIEKLTIAYHHYNQLLLLKAGISPEEIGKIEGLKALREIHFTSTFAKAKKEKDEKIPVPSLQSITLEAFLSKIQTLHKTIFDKVIKSLDPENAADNKPSAP